MEKRTKIVCTIGPASESKETIKAMVKAGMNVARLNFSHGTYSNHALLIKNIRAVEVETGEPVAIMQDLRGPKIRVGVLPEVGVELKEKETVFFDTTNPEYKKDIIPIDFTDLQEFVKPGERILFNDGRIEVKIIAVKDSKITTIVVVGGLLLSQKGINVPDSHFTGRALTEKDKADVEFGLQAGVDLMAMSFVTDAEDVLDLKYLIKETEILLGHKPEQPIRIIAKIERAEAVKNIARILSSCPTRGKGHLISSCKPQTGPRETAASDRFYPEYHRRPL